MKMKNLKHVLMGTLAILACAACTDNEDKGGAIDEGKTTVVSLYSEESCLEENQLAGNVLVKQGESLSLDVNIPVHCQNVYMKYASASGNQVKVIALDAPVRNGMSVTSTRYTASSSFDWATTRTVPVAVYFPEDAVAPTSEEDGGFRFYHNTGVAMFEDNWPIEPGRDNDFNDVVFEYDLKVTECQKDDLLPAHGYKEGLLLTLDVRAKGGLFPTKLGVVLEGFESSFISEVNTRIVLKKGQGMMEELATGKNSAEVREINGKKQYCKVTVDTEHGSPVIIMDGLSDLGDKVNFFQTRKGYIIEGQPMLRAEIKLTGRNRSELTSQESQAQLTAYRNLITDTKNQNFFIVTSNRREIHMKGYKPTYLYTTYDTDSQDLMADGIPYCSKNGFVWGMKVPVGVKHAYEEVLFEDAYPDFRAWVESNGTDNKEWYLNSDAENVVRYW